MAEAGVVDEVARVDGRPMRREIGRRSSGDKALHTRPDGDRDHVALDPLLVAHAGVEAIPDHVDQVVVGGDLEGHAGMGGKEAGRDRRQDLHRHDHRHIELERPARA